MNRINRTLAISVALGCLALSACSDDDKSTSPTDSAAQMPPSVEPAAATKEIWSEIQDYESWEQWPEGKEKKLSESHQSMYVESYYNGVVEAFEGSGDKPPLPSGAIIVKENFMKETDAEPLVLTVMKKQEDGNWYWIKALAANGRVLLGPDGKTPAEGENVTTCMGCHSAMAPSGNDMVVTHAFGQ